MAEDGAAREQPHDRCLLGSAVLTPSDCEARSPTIGNKNLNRIPSTVQLDALLCEIGQRMIRLCSVRLQNEALAWDSDASEEDAPTWNRSVPERRDVVARDNLERRDTDAFGSQRGS
jgi:hypothetical protein